MCGLMSRRPLCNSYIHTGLGSTFLCSSSDERHFDLRRARPNTFPLSLEIILYTFRSDRGTGWQEILAEVTDVKLKIHMAPISSL